MTLAASACSSSDDGIWMPPGGDGKADGYTTIKGSDIPSQFVDPNKSYIISRNIENLATVGAFDTVQASLAKRIDGIIANMPSDGKLHLAELVRMEDPTIHASLFPNEQAALPKLWKLVEAPDGNDSLYGPSDNFGVLDDSLPPAAAVPPATIVISSLLSEQRDPATRLQNLYNSDNDVNTVSLADLASGIANPAAFTPTEITAFMASQAEFRNRAVAHSDAKLVMSPGPGTFTKDGNLGPAMFHITGATKIDENRNVYSTQFTGSLTATQSLTATVALPNSAQVLVLSQDSGAETVFGAGAVPGAVTGGTYVFEVWDQGQRTFSSNAHVPSMTTNQTIQLDDKLDYTVTSGLSSLVRNVSSATATYNGGYYTFAVHYTFDKTAIMPPPNTNQAAISATTSPTISLPVGRYTIGQTGSILYVYPNNVLWFSYHGTQVRLVPQGNSGNPLLRLYANQFNVSYDASSNDLYCSSCQPSVSVRLTSSQRDI